MGSMNFGLYHLLAKYKEFKFEWEKQHLEATPDHARRELVSVAQDRD